MMIFIITHLHTHNMCNIIVHFGFRFDMNVILDSSLVLNMGLYIIHRISEHAL